MGELIHKFAYDDTAIFDFCMENGFSLRGLPYPDIGFEARVNVLEVIVPKWNDVTIGLLTWVGDHAAVDCTQSYKQLQYRWN